MRVLFIGGTGIISTACTSLAASRGIDLTLLTRGHRHAGLPAGVKTLTVDYSDQEATRQALAKESFDVVVDWIAFTPDQIENDIQLFGGRIRQFIFISSAAAYQRPSTSYLVTESTPLANPFWDYARNKIACEERLTAAWRSEGFPITIVRPSLTYGESQITLPVNVWTKSYTAVDRMRRGQKVIVPGDGSSLWVITHNSDFAKGLVGLLGHEQAIGHAFHITSDEVMTWDQFYRITAEAAGAEPKLVHIPAELIAACLPQTRGSLLGDKLTSVVFDNSKIKRFVPGFEATTRYGEGIRRTIAWFDADPARRQVDEEWNASWDRLIAAYETASNEIIRQFQP